MEACGVSCWGHTATPAVLGIWRLWANVLKFRDWHAKPMVRKTATDVPARIFFKRILFLLSRQLPHRCETGSCVLPAPKEDHLLCTSLVSTSSVIAMCSAKMELRS